MVKWWFEFLFLLVICQITLYESFRRHASEKGKFTVLSTKRVSCCKTLQVTRGVRYRFRALDTAPLPVDNFTAILGPEVTIKVGYKLAADFDGDASRPVSGEILIVPSISRVLVGKTVAEETTIGTANRTKKLMKKDEISVEVPFSVAKAITVLVAEVKVGATVTSMTSGTPKKKVATSPATVKAAGLRSAEAVKNTEKKTKSVEKKSSTALTTVTLISKDAKIAGKPLKSIIAGITSLTVVKEKYLIEAVVSSTSLCAKANTARKDPQTTASQAATLQLQLIPKSTVKRSATATAVTAKVVSKRVKSSLSSSSLTKVISATEDSSAIKPVKSKVASIKKAATVTAQAIAGPTGVIEREKKVTWANTKKELEKSFYCYFIISGNKTYNGYTVDLKRRLRQHNGIIKGGAKSTRSGKGGWSYLAVLTAPGWNAVRAMQVEWLCKYPTRKKPRPRIYSRPLGRLRSLGSVCSHLLESFDRSLNLHLSEEYYDTFISSEEFSQVPSFVTVKEGFKGLQIC